MSTIDSYIKALLTLSGDEQLVGARHALPQSLNDEGLADLVEKVVGREFVRAGMEDIASVVLDTIARDPTSGDIRAASGVQTTEVKAEDQPSGISILFLPPSSLMLLGDRSIRASTPASQATTWAAQPQFNPGVLIVAVSLRCQTEQITANMTVPPTQYVCWSPVLDSYVDLRFDSQDTIRASY
ncbi:hypothetical protein G6011_11723 [Alternaria panax]|uniref:Uncharacterized protein n=1 Tax=Alternaria panax TaxID=48097 RepID=A0AAD4IEE0_9PLEO|nr:hypothetical protein G6011_11723 [Alternaria panax]